MAKIISKTQIPVIQNPQSNQTLQTKVLRYHLSPALIYLMGAIVFSWPLVLHLTDHVILTGSGDAWAHLWNSWWARFSLLDLHNSPFRTDALYWPQGASLYFHALDPFTGYLSIFFQLLFGLVPAFNLMVLFEITLAGYAAMQLARYLTGNFAAALVGGVIYAFSPLESLYLNLGQLELMSIGWLPLFILFFIKTLRREPRLRLNFVLSIVFLLIISLVTWYYLLYALIFAGLYTLYVLFEQRRLWRSDWLKLVGLAAGVFVIYLLLISPILLPTLKEANGGGTQAKQSISNVIYNSSDLKSLFWPEPSLLWGGLGVPNPLNQTVYHDGAFLGFVALLLVGFGLATNFKRSWFWAVLALVFLLLALGPVLLTHYCYNLASGFDKQNHLLLTCSDTEPPQIGQAVTLPGKLLFDLPFGSIARVPLRFELLVMLSFAVLGTWAIVTGQKLLLRFYARRGQAEITKRSRKLNWLNWLLPLSVGILIFAEFLPLPRVLHDTAVSPFYTQIKSEGNWNDFALLETPDKVLAIAEYYQTVHQHPILGGYLSRKQDYPYDATPGWYELSHLNFRTQANDIIDQSSLANTPLVLGYYKIRYVVLHPQYLNADELVTATDVLKATLGNSQPYYQDKELAAYRVPENIAQAITSKDLVLDLGQGWNKLENGQRSLNDAAQLLIFNPSHTALAVQLNTQVQSKATAQELSLKQTNGEKEVLVGKAAINTQPTNVSFDLTLQPGLNTITLQPSVKGKSTLTFGIMTVK